ncbi:AGE family epimerase/isomerase [Shimia abyssi]|uniref:Mannose/cellobiose epimerase-like protein (N-acyl-D-glucosamine 2-epimerase family) n=1 Tax=Shimia abyssi TaxID=1662395 RepID=A0A2P8FCD6_9RHOB|nr:AGE family epimerase/isomerase [Shimia abyssi]PSL19342.1 mannose/cellobiose epimerase-like protein (N-acyl-D-glucosamine 2-epimerase family) [Shimia abyssi]
MKNSSHSAPVGLLAEAEHRDMLKQNARDNLAFFRPSLRSGSGFHVLGWDGAPLADTVQELHTTTRLVHSYALGKLANVDGCDAIIDQGMRYLQSHHHDKAHGGFVWALDGETVHDGRKLAYGHVFVLLAGASARMVGHPDADALIDQVTAELDTHFWDEDRGLLADEFNRDWTPFSNYRGMNANMHGVEAHLTAFEATGRDIYLSRAGRILDFFMGQIAPEHGWRLPEHYDSDWQVTPDYAENPMFRPRGTTPGHSFELARLLLQHWDLAGRNGREAPEIARRVAYRALEDAWDEVRGGFFYTLDFDGTPDIRDRYWWPVTEAIGVLAALIKHAPRPEDEKWYARVWAFAEAHFIDHDAGGWFPEIDNAGKPTGAQFMGKPDIYHALQATLFPLAPGISRMAEELPDLST